MVARKSIQDAGKEWNQITMESNNTNTLPKKGSTPIQTEHPKVRRKTHLHEKSLLKQITGTRIWAIRPATTRKPRKRASTDAHESNKRSTEQPNKKRVSKSNRLMLSQSKQKKYPPSDETFENKEERCTYQVQTDKGTFIQHER